MRVVRITVDFWRPSFHGLDGRNRPEWPPSPFRLAQALMAGCQVPSPDPDARAALEALTTLPNPDIIAPRAVPSPLPDTYTHRTGEPLTVKEIRGKDLVDFLDLSVAGLSSKNRVPKPMGFTLLGDCRLVYEVEDPREVVDVDALDRAARRVPYLGRSHDGCDLSVEAASSALLLEDSATHRRLVSMPDSRGGTRGWSPRSCAWMDANYDAAMSGSQIPAPPPDTAVIMLTYAPVRPGGQRPASPSDRVDVLPLARPVTPARITSVMSRLTEALPSAASSDTRLFPAVFCGHDRADGRMLGVGVVDADAERRRATLRILSALPLVQADDPRAPTQTLTPGTWEGPATRWRSATPLRAFPDEFVANHVIGGEAERTAGASATITWSRFPVEAWQRPWRQPEDGLALWWAELTFETPVTGPLSLGPDQDRGFGLFVPSSPQGARS